MNAPQCIMLLSDAVSKTVSDNRKTRRGHLTKHHNQDNIKLPEFHKI